MQRPVARIAWWYLVGAMVLAVGAGAADSAMPQARAVVDRGGHARHAALSIDGGIAVAEAAVTVADRGGAERLPLAADSLLALGVLAAACCWWLSAGTSPAHHGIVRDLRHGGRAPPSALLTLI
jgi:hypothetical protein